LHPAPPGAPLSFSPSLQHFSSEMDSPLGIRLNSAHGSGIRNKGSCNRNDRGVSLRSSALELSLFWFLFFAALELAQSSTFLHPENLSGNRSPHD
jgi:hypothetical protein